MAKHRDISVRRGFVDVDARFGREWPIAYEEVRAIWKKMDHFFVQHPDLDYSVGGLLQLAAPRHMDYLCAVRDIAQKHKGALEIK
jgi:hypothetical protein